MFGTREEGDFNPRSDRLVPVSKAAVDRIYSADPGTAVTPLTEELDSLKQTVLLGRLACDLREWAQNFVFQ